jgi:cytochrome c peroxidase
LRNVALTAPYMHDGRFANLPEVLAFYAQGKGATHGRLVGTRDANLALVPRLTAEQRADLVAFLGALTGAPLPSALTEPPPQP